jgi:hypothetical protein
LFGASTVSRALSDEWNESDDAFDVWHGGKGQMWHLWTIKLCVDMTCAPEVDYPYFRGAD